MTLMVVTIILSAAMWVVADEVEKLEDQVEELKEVLKNEN